MRVVIAAWLVMTSACLQSSDVVCDGFICPAGNRCDNVNHLCIDPEQLLACAELGDGAPCSVDSAEGACRDHVCIPFRCGDGVVNGGEQCDGDDLGALDCTAFAFTKPEGLACLPNCRVDVSNCQGFCGDGARDGIELCDGPDLGGATCQDLGFYEPAGLGCDLGCHFVTDSCVGRCGDGIVNGPEVCDGSLIAACVDAGLDLGSMRCGDLCTPTTQTCGRLDWRVLAAEATGTIKGVASHTFVSGTPIGVLRFEGGSWTPMPGTPTGAGAIDGRAADDITVAATDGIFHFDGAAFTKLTPLGPATVVNAIAAFATDDIWIAADQLDATSSTPVLIHWDGSFLAATELPAGARVTAMFGAARDDIWAVGFFLTGGPLVVHYDGTSWTPFAVPTTSELFYLWGFGRDDIWMAGQGVTLHFDGQSWRDVPLPAARRGGIVGIAGSGPDDVLAIANIPFTQTSEALHWNGTRWQIAGELPFTALAIAEFGGEVMVVSPSLGQLVFRARGVAEWSTAASPPQAEDVFVAAQDAAWVTTANGDVHRWNGVAWSPESITTDGFTVPLQARVIRGVSPVDVWAGFPGTAHWDGQAWTQITTGAQPPVQVKAIWGSAMDAWAIDGNADFWRWNGSAWLSTVRPPGGTPYTGLTGSAPDDVWAFNFREAAHFDGTTWTLTPTPPLPGVITSLSAPRANEAWLAGDRFVLIWDGTAWTEAPSQSLFHTGICARSLDDVYVVSDRGLDHYDGVAWSPIRLAPGAPVSLDKIDCVPHLVVVGEFANAAAVLGIHGRWACRAQETACNDDLDDDCDGLVDRFDPDCP